MSPNELIACAATIFKVDPSSLSLDTTVGSIPEWDSVNHLRLILEAEKRFGVYYPMERIPTLQSLADFL